jgi:capsid protein
MIDRKPENRDMLARSVADKLMVLSAGNLPRPMAVNYGYGGRGQIGAGRYAGYESGGAKFPGGLSGDGTGFGIDHWRSRQNGRRAYHDSSVARSVVERYKEQVAGVGLKFVFEINHLILGIPEERAEEEGEINTERFHLWANSPDCYRTRNMNLYQSQGLYAIQQQRDNDQFIRFFYSSDRSLMNPLQFLFIDPEQIVGDAFTSSYNYDWPNDGIVRNSEGVETAYKVRVKIKGQYETRTIPAFGARSGRRMMKHGFYQEYAGQTRGYSRLVSGLQGFQTLEDFTLSHIMKAINQASFYMFNQPAADADASDIFDDLAKVPAGPPSLQYGSSPEPAGDSENVTDEATVPIQHYQLPETAFTRPGSHVITNLRRGEKVVPFASTAPADQYDKFVDSFTAYLSAASGMPIEVLLMRFNENYSASRAALILAYRIAMMWQMEMRADFLDIVLELWMAEEIAAGRITAPGWSDPIMRAAWMSGKWRGFPIPNIDPSRMAKADLINVKELAAKTHDDVAWEVSQSSGKSNRAKVRKEIEELPVKPEDRTVNI